MDIRELEETAQLAHLNLGKDELAAALPAFEQMIGFFAAMQEADNDAAFIRQDAHAASGGNPESAKPGESLSAQRSLPVAGARLVGAEHFRLDDSKAFAVPGTDSGLNEKILDNPGERDGRFIVIPNVL